MRLVAGIALIAHGIEKFRTGQPIEPVILDLLAIGDGVLLVAGLWTPFAGSLVVIHSAWSAVVLSGNPCSCIFLMTFGVALVLLGPGGWSVDAYLFGWKRINFQDR
jgi:putative oxidoreductase